MAAAVDVTHSPPPFVGRLARRDRGSAGDSPAPLGDSPSGMGRRHRWLERLMSLTALPLPSGEVARRNRPVACSTRGPRAYWPRVMTFLMPVALPRSNWR